MAQDMAVPDVFITKVKELVSDRGYTAAWQKIGETHRSPDGFRRRERPDTVRQPKVRLGRNRPCRNNQ